MIGNNPPFSKTIDFMLDTIGQRGIIYAKIKTRIESINTTNLI